MGQYDVIEFLEKNKDEWFTANTIRKALNNNCVIVSLKKLKSSNMIKYKEEYSDEHKVCRKVLFYKWKK